MAKDFHINPKRTYPWEPVGVPSIDSQEEDHNYSQKIVVKGD